MIYQDFHADKGHHPTDLKPPRPDFGGSRSRDVAKMDVQAFNNIELSIFPGKNHQQQNAFAGYSWSLRKNDGFEVANMSL